MTDSTADYAAPVAGYDGWAVLDLTTQSLIRANARGQELLGLPADQLPATLNDFLTSTDHALVTNRVLPILRSGSQWQGGLRLGHQRIDAAPSPVMIVPHISANTALEPEYASLLFASSDVSDAAAMVPDPLTGLPTRSALFLRLERAVRRNRTSAHLLGAFFLDLDGLKQVNDRYGHEVGDTALIETAQRIAAALPPGALAVRFGGDEFVVIHEQLDDLDAATGFADEILAALNSVSDYHAISASIGIAVGRSGEVDGQELIRRADSAMYKAKALGGSQVAVFDAEMRTRQQDNAELRSSLLAAISNNGFGVAAQPIFEIGTGRVSGVELFIRIRDDTPYIANANQLFRLAHEYGEAFDAAVLGRSLALARLWQDSFGAEAPRVHINISSQSLAASHFARRVGLALSNDRVRPGAIAFEIDSGDLGLAGDRERATIKALRELGVPLVIDGFSGNALSLQDLAELQPIMVKLSSPDHSSTVLAGLIRGISTLSIPTCVKGLSTDRDLAIAVAIGAFSGQGNALTPVRRVEHVNDLLHGPQRLGF